LNALTREQINLNVSGTWRDKQQFNSYFVLKDYPGNLVHTFQKPRDDTVDVNFVAIATFGHLAEHFGRLHVRRLTVKVFVRISLKKDEARLSPKVLTLEFRRWNH